ncbi:hypothetical protein V1525DRAFT_424879 [Lipomyces kononenkoae]|uniref:Uncharacterized protein n=1 Tax=Lipomyces kononenkoae TaxID=34357 RepID=A0ACC3T549_LIPKO
MGTLSSVIACFLAAACLWTGVEDQPRIFMRPYRLIVTDIIFLACWAFSMPMLVIEYPDENQNFEIYKLLLVSCVVNLIIWSTSTGLDCCQFGDTLITENPAVDEDATVIQQSTISRLEDGTVRMVCENLKPQKPENAIIKEDVAYVW